MEVILSMDPNLAKLIVYEAPNTTQGYNDEFARIVKDRTPVISVSWGDCEQNMGQQEVNQENQFFQQAAAQGRSEEHTSELQSHSDLVCRLLLEKKNKNI